MKIKNILELINIEMGICRQKWELMKKHKSKERDRYVEVSKL